MAVRRRWLVVRGGLLPVGRGGLLVGRGAVRRVAWVWAVVVVHGLTEFFA